MDTNKRQKVFTPNREELVKDLNNSCNISRDYVNMSSSLLLQFKSRVKALEDGIQFQSESELLKYIAETNTILGQLDGYASLCQETVNKGTEIASKLGL